MGSPVIGIDGGGTQTRAVVLDAAGQWVGQGRAGASGYAADPAHAQAALREAWTRACDAAGLSPSGVAGAFLGIAGVVTGTEREAVRKRAAELGFLPAARIGVDHDIAIAWAGAFAGEPGLAVISGTGSSCYGRNQAGQAVQTGGWGHVVDDFGSGYRLALDGLTAAVRGADGRGPATMLTERLFGELGIDTLPQIVGRLHRGSAAEPGQAMQKQEIAALAPTVLAAAEAGDAVAQALVERAAGELALMARTAADRLELTGAARRVALAGSVAGNPAIATPLTRRLQDEPSPIAVAAARFEPVIGAALLAKAQLGEPLDERVIEPLEGANDQKRETVS
jgi:N-acetylglucosamine kinase-like BadF-type ATPase